MCFLLRRRLDFTNCGDIFQVDISVLAEDRAAVNSALRLCYISVDAANIAILVGPYRHDQQCLLRHQIKKAPEVYSKALRYAHTPVDLISRDQPSFPELFDESIHRQVPALHFGTGNEPAIRDNNTINIGGSVLRGLNKIKSRESLPKQSYCSLLLNAGLLSLRR